MNAAERFFAKVQPGPNGCLLWTGAVDSKGYGRFQDIDGRNMPAHRWLLERVFGRNADKVADHLCRTPSCVRPTHLEFVTPSENILRGVLPERTRARAAARTHCLHGHELSGDNLYDYTSPNGKRSRICKACQTAVQRSERHRPRFALNQRRFRSNRAACAASQRVVVLHGPGGIPLPVVTVFAGDSEDLLEVEMQRALTLYRENAEHVLIGGRR